MVQEEYVGHSKGKILSIEHLSRKFTNKTVLNDVSLDIMENSVHAIIGPNGAGKTTIIRTILGLYKLENGKINCSVDSNQISCLLENDYLFESKTGQENIDAFCEYFDIDKNKVSEKLHYYAEILNLEQHLEYKLKIYSKGMRRKLSILITLLRDTKLIIFDEPTSGIDPQSRIEIRKLFRILKDENKTIILTSHDLEEVKKVSTTISIINSGVILQTFINNDDMVNLEKIFFDAIGDESYYE